jgi:hypothetical protein
MRSIDGDRIACAMHPCIISIPTADIREVAAEALEHDPEKWTPVFPRDKREAFARRSCSNDKLERDDDWKKNHLALGSGRVRSAISRPQIYVNRARGKMLRD